ncbi:MAG TPA: hypothetical protein VGV63_10875 [Acidimicrobiales bacterium]|nr:hypothetical protein [Acidimicrobiales bacterium]
MRAAIAGWVQGMATTGVGAVMGLLAGGRVGAAVGAALSGLFAIPFGRAVARGRPYQGPDGLRRCIVDATWSSPNTWAGALFHGALRLRGNPLDVDRTRGTGSIWLVNGVVPRYATTIGTVKAGSNERIDRHEEVHVLQARLFGPFYLPLVAVNFVVATLFPYWLLFPDRAGYTIDSVGAYFERGVYPHVWHELWAYRAAGRASPGGPRRAGSKGIDEGTHRR